MEPYDENTAVLQFDDVLTTTRLATVGGLSR
jgi:hypothetical protein